MGTVARALLICCALAISAGKATAQDVCAAVVNGELLRFDRETFLVDRDTATLRERALAWPGRKWDGLRGRDPECDSVTLITYLSQTVPADQIDDFCLAEVDEAGFLLIPGPRNFRGRCTGPVCNAVNVTASTTKAVTGAVATAVADTALGRDRPGGVIHSSGAAILSGQIGTVTSALGSIGTGLTAALSSPAVLAATAVSVVAVGGAVYVCRD